MCGPHSHCRRPSRLRPRLRVQSIGQCGCIPHVDSALASSTPVIPSGLKSFCLADPNQLGTAADCPVITCGTVTYWVFSLADNSDGMTLVGYDPSGHVAPFRPAIAPSGRPSRPGRRLTNSVSRLGLVARLTGPFRHSHTIALADSYRFGCLGGSGAGPGRGARTWGAGCCLGLLEGQAQAGRQGIAQGDALLAGIEGHDVLDQQSGAFRAQGA